jgi:CTD small phosphatase-like protein 2
MSDLCLLNQRSYDESPQGMKGQNYNIAMVKKIMESPDKNNKNMSNNNINNDSDINSNQLQINLQDLLIMEEKLRDILSALRVGKSIKNECFEWWNYFFHCTLYINLEQLFKDEHSKSILQKSIKVQLLTLLISYDSSIDAYLFSQIQEVLYSMLQCNHFNWGTICEYILSKIAIDNYDNPWVEKLRTIVIKNQNRNQHNNLIYIERIEYNTDSIYNDIRVILKYYQNGNSKTKILMNIYKSIEKISYSDLNKLFQEKFMQVENANASVLASVVLRENSHFKTVPAPYIKTKSLKQYTLVLDLDETIMHFKVNPDNELEGVLRVRPGIYDFLDQLSKYYEMIIFTAATQDYADILIDSIEETKIYFEYRLYRQHAVIIDNDFVKDLTRIGRSLDKVVIVDNMPQNFRLQQDNGIIIKPFWGEDINDSALYELMPILMNIAIEGGDIRNGLARYRDDIIRKVSSNLSRQSFDFC